MIPEGFHPRPLRYLIVLLLILVGLESRAQLDYWPSRHISSRDGLPTDMIWQSVEDSDGFLWIATEDGLVRFDGYDMIVLKKQSGLPLLDENFIYTVTARGPQEVWFSTHRELYSLNTHSFESRRIEFIPADFKSKSSLDFSINCTYVDPAGTIWIGTSQGLFGIDAKGQPVGPFQWAEQPDHKGFVNHILGITMAPDGQLWLNCGAGIRSLNPKSGDSNLFPVPGQQYHDRAILWHQGRVYSGGEQLSVLDPSTGEHEVLITYAQSGGLFVDLVISSSEPDELWCIIRGGGLVAFSIPNHTSTTYTADIQLNRITPSMINQGYFTPSGIWLSTSYGLHFLRNDVGFIKTFPPRTTGEGFHQFISLFPSHHPNQKQYIWLVQDDGLWLWNTLDHTFSPQGHLMGTGSGEIIDPWNIWCYHQGRNGSLIADKSSGLFDCSGNRCQQIVSWDTLRPPGDDYRWIVSSSAESEDGTVWMSASTHLLEIQDDQIQLHQPPPVIGPSGDTLMAKPAFNDVLIDHRGMVWLCSGFQVERHLVGICRYDPSKASFAWFVPDPRVPGSFPKCSNLMQMSLDEMGQIWIATESDGLLRFDPSASSPHFTRIPTHEWTSSSYSQGVACVGNQTWTATRAGLLKLDANAHYDLFTSDDGLVHNRLHSTLASTWQGIAFITKGILHFVETGAVPERNAKGKLVLTDFLIDGRRPDSHMSAHTLDHLTIPWNANSMSFQFALIDFAASGNIEYAHMLKGIDPDWITDGSYRTFTYSNLPAGDYTLLVRMRTGQGAWSDALMSLPVRVERAWFKSPIFIGALIALFLAGLYLIYRMRIRQLQRESRLRNRIAADLHDEVGSSLSSIAIYGDLINQVVTTDPARAQMLSGKMKESATESLERMRDIVWNLNTRNDSLLRTIEYMKRSAADQLENSGIQLEFESDHGIDDLATGLEWRKNLFLIFREAVNNARKHSGADQVRIRIHLDGGVLEMTVCDNGSGMVKNDSTQGNGLINMKNRAQQMRGEIHFEGIPGGGTCVRLRVPCLHAI